MLLKDEDYKELKKRIDLANISNKSVVTFMGTKLDIDVAVKMYESYKNNK